MPCPACGELTVLFRNKAIPLDRRVLERGSRKERIEHCARVITEFLEAGMFPPDFSGGPRPRRRRRRPSPEAAMREDAPGPCDVRPDPGITDADLNHFVNVELGQLDDPECFRKLFG